MKRTVFVPRPSMDSPLTAERRSEDGPEVVSEPRRASSSLPEIVSDSEDVILFGRPVNVTDSTCRGGPANCVEFNVVNANGEVDLTESCVADGGGQEPVPVQQPRSAGSVDFPEFLALANLGRGPDVVEEVPAPVYNDGDEGYNDGAERSDSIDFLGFSSSQVRLFPEHSESEKTGCCGCSIM